MNSDMRSGVPSREKGLVYDNKPQDSWRWRNFPPVEIIPVEIVPWQTSPPPCSRDATPLGDLYMLMHETSCPQHGTARPALFGTMLTPNSYGLKSRKVGDTSSSPAWLMPCFSCAYE